MISALGLTQAPAPFVKRIESAKRIGGPKGFDRRLVEEQRAKFWCIARQALGVQSNAFNYAIWSEEYAPIFVSIVENHIDPTICAVLHKQDWRRGAALPPTSSRPRYVNLGRLANRQAFQKQLKKIAAQEVVEEAQRERCAQLALDATLRILSELDWKTFFLQFWRMRNAPTPPAAGAA